MLYFGRAKSALMNIYDNTTEPRNLPWLARLSDDTRSDYGFLRLFGYFSVCLCLHRGVPQGELSVQSSLPGWIAWWKMEVSAD